MKKGSGYTILEVLIFIAISGLMLIIAVSAVGGRQQEVQFQQGVRDFENKINDLISDVEVGYFVRNAGYSCREFSSAPDVSYTSGLTGNVQGQSGECTLMGKTIVMGEEEEIDGNVQDEVDKGILRIFDMAGLRLNDDDEAVGSIEEALPVPVTTGDSPVEIYQLRYGIEVEKVVLYDREAPPATAAIDAAEALAIMNSANAGTVADLVGGTQAKAGSTSAKVVTATFNQSGTTGATSGLSNFASNWRVAGDLVNPQPNFTSIVICISGPNARGISGNVTNWTHREVASLVISPAGATQLVFDGSEVYCE